MNIPSSLKDLWDKSLPEQPPSADILAGLLLRDGGDDVTACALAASLTCLLWQCAGEGKENIPGVIPSVLVVTSDGDHEDTLSRLVLPLLGSIGHRCDSTTAYPNFNPLDPAPREIWGMIQRMLKVGRMDMVEGLAKRWDRWNEETLDISRRRVPLYGRRDGFFGVFHDRYGRRFFTVTTAEDVAQLRAEMKDPKHDVFHPAGQARLHRVKRHTPLFGMVPAGSLDGFMVDRAVEAGSPVLFLPCGTPPSPEKEGWVRLTALAGMLGMALEYGQEPFIRQERTLVGSIGRDYLPPIQSRLLHYPPDFVFFVLDTVRNVQKLAVRIGEWVNRGTVRPGMPETLARHIACRAARGVLFALEMLAWYGYGFAAPPVPGHVCRKILRRLQATPEPLTRRELQRAAREVGSAENLGRVLECFQGQGLAILEGKYARAVPFDLFLRGLPFRPLDPSAGDNSDRSARGERTGD